MKLIKVAAAVAGLSAFLPPLSANALSLGDLDPGKILGAMTSAKVDVHNYYKFPVMVVMDRNREQHLIAPNGVATFTQANKADRPTFRAHQNGADGPILDSKSVFIDGGNKTVDFGR